MDSLELLNVLDVIKNEEVYTARLNQLKQHQAKLDESQYIVKTVELAQKKLDDAEKLQAKYKDLVEKLEQNLKSVRFQIEQEYQDKNKQLKFREDSVAKLAEESRKLVAEARELGKQQEQERKVLLEWDTILNKQKEEINKLEQILTSKFSRIKHIIEE